MDTRPVGVFDSGMGGISLLRNLTRLLPGENFIYYGDDKNAPYGTRPENEILKLALDDVGFLKSHGAKAIVIACNTATSAAAARLRATEELPIIGIEPALKPACLADLGGKTLVLATPATLRQSKFMLLMNKYGSDAIPLPCPGLMEFAERGETESTALDEYLISLFKPYAGVNITAAVLGCTHYTFLAKAIAKALPHARLYDGNEGTARQLKRVLEANKLLGAQSGGSVKMYTSGNAEVLLPIMQKLYNTKIAELVI